MNMNESVVRKALDWIHTRLQESPDANRAKLISDASVEFGLSPLQGEFLCREFLIQKQGVKTATL